MCLTHRLGKSESILKRKIGNKSLGRLTERRSGANVKDNLLKDIYNLYSLGEGSIESFQQQEVQTDSCLSKTLFAVPRPKLRL